MSVAVWPGSPASSKFTHPASGHRYADIHPEDAAGARLLVGVALFAGASLVLFPPGSFATRPAGLRTTR